MKSSLSDDAQRKLVDDYIKELPARAQGRPRVSEIAKVFKGLPKRFNKAGVKAERSYYFSLGDHEKWTVHIAEDKCTVEKGKNGDADCFFKASARALPRRLERQAPARRDGLPDRAGQEQQPDAAQGVRRRVPEVEVGSASM